VLAAPARAQVTPPPPPPEEPLIAADVTIAGVAVGGMTGAEATTAVQAEFAKPLTIRHKTRSWRVWPSRFRARANVEPAVERALAAEPGTAVRLVVTWNANRVHSYVELLDSLLSRKPRNSQLLLRSLRPYLTPARPGLEVLNLRMRIAVTRAIQYTKRTPIALPANVIRPEVTRANYGPIIVIRRGSRKLYLYRNMSLVRRFAVAVGTLSHPTPIGRFRVITKERNPTWDPPNSPWAEGLGPIPPGPGNPLGTRWIGTSAPAIGIHGTPQPWTVGTAASHGCIRMYMREVEWLFERVRVGTPVFIVRA
jgi:lipoprotein-anchoring transpeptidase ErfK/SrfK